MSQTKEVRYTARSITPPPETRSTSPNPRRRSASKSPPRSRDRSRSRSRDGVRNPGNNLYVTGLSMRVTSSDLEKYFNKEGKVLECQVVLDPRTKESRGFAFVTMETVEDAEHCIKYLHRSVLEGRLITVEKAKRKRERTPTPGKYRGLRGESRRGSRSRSPHRSRRRQRSHSRERRERSRSRDRHYSSRPRDRRERSRSPYAKEPQRRSRDRRERSRSPYAKEPQRRRRERSSSPTGNGNHVSD